MDLISVIIPVYDVERYLKRCVESVQKQTYTNLEIILVDDGSPDNCPQLCEQFAAEDTRIKVVHKENGGLGFARNSGLEVATGEYVAFLDSDDWIAETRIANLYAAIKENNADVVIGSHSIATDLEHSTPERLRIPEGLYEGDAVLNDILLPFLGPDVDFPQDVQIESACWSKLYRREIITANHLQFPSEKLAVGEDMFFGVRYFSFAKRVVVINETGHYYFQNQESITRKYNPKRFERTLNFYTNVCQLVRDCNLENVAAHRAERTFLLKMRTAIRLVVVSDMSRKEKLQEIRRYLENETVAAVLMNYPIETLIPAMRYLSKLMRAKNAAGVYYLMRVREITKRQKLLKRAVKLIGVGK